MLLRLTPSLSHVASPSSTSCLRLSIVIDWGTRRTPVGRADDCGAQSGGLRARIADDDVYSQRAMNIIIIIQTLAILQVTLCAY